MNEELIKKLSENLINNIDLIEVIEAGPKNLYHDEDILFVLTHDDILFVDCPDIIKGSLFISNIANIDAFVVRQEEYIDFIKNKFAFENAISVYNWVYDKSKIDIIEVSGIAIKTLNDSYYELVNQYYSRDEDEVYLRDRLNSGYFFGAFDQDKLVGFIGVHEEGSMGFLEVIPEYQRRGIAKYLETFLIDLLLKEGKIPFGQTKIENDAQINANLKLGLKQSEIVITWIM